ncbi:MAG TPA: sialidase, partial [Candidatus Angelobacter sp.]
DATFSGSSRTTDAFITYYQKSRHIFGDMKIEIIDPDGKVVDTIAGSKHRGLNRATWSMRLKPPTVPPAASAAFGAATGPRVLPGTYTIKMTKGDQVYTSKLKLVLDPRAPYNEQDRRQQFDLAMKIYKLIERMSFAVDSMVNLRDTATARAAKLSAKDPLRNNVQQLAQQADALRSKIVATKEGGAITGEERIREYLTSVYGDVNNYDGKPTNSQIERTDALGHELDDVIKELDQLTAKQLPAINSELQKKKLEPIQPLTQDQWEKMHQGDTGAQPGMMGIRERD